MIPTLRTLLTLALLAASWRVFHQLAALQISRSLPGIDGLNEAIKWDPEGSDYYFQLGLMYRDRIESQDLTLARINLERAASLNPFSWHYWLELGKCYEFSGLPKEAEKAYLKAVELNPRSAAYHWLLANFYIRRGNLERSFAELRAAIELDRSRSREGLKLLWKVGATEVEIDQLWPKDRESHLMLLQFAIKERKELDFIQRKWQHLLNNFKPPSVSEGSFYVRYLLGQVHYEEARTEWIRLARSDGVQENSYQSKTNYVWNGGFEIPSTGEVLDWRFSSSQIFSISQVDKQGIDGSEALRVDFHGTQNIDFRGLEQDVLVDAESEYEFSMTARSEDITTDQGVYFEIVNGKTGVVLLETPQIRGTTSWTRYSGFFRVEAHTPILGLALRRRPSRKIDSLIRGTLWLDSVALKKLSPENKTKMTAAVAFLRWV